MSKAWGNINIGHWADDVEAAEAEEREAASKPASAEPQSFPSLKEAVTSKQKKKKMSLNEFHSSSAASGGGGGLFESKGLTPDEMLRLPTGPKERSADEMQYGRLGGGFSNYGRSGPPPGRMRDDPDGGGWGGGRRPYGGFDEQRRTPPPRVSDHDQPSRADEVDNWAMTKKPLQSSYDSGRQSRYGSLGGGDFGGGSRADEVDSWTMGKKPLPTRSSTFGSGFRDSRPEPDRWSRGGGGGGILETERERRRLVLDPPRGDVIKDETPKTNKPNPFGAARPREEVLAEKGLDWKKLESEIDAKKGSAHSSRPTSAHSSRPSSAHSSRSEGQGMHQGMENVGVRPRPKVNPFGDAKPREVLLEERGQDWRKIDLDLEHRAVDRPETEEEKLLKEEIEHFKKESIQGSAKEQPSFQDILAQKERELDLLIRDLDDKVRFGQKAVERPGSGAGRVVGFNERPHSRSGSIDESKSNEFMDRPRSRGTPDIWTRPGEDRRGSFGRERGFPGNRGFDRPRTGDRW